MSAQPISIGAAAAPSDPNAAMARVQQLQAMLAQVANPLATTQSNGGTVAATPVSSSTATTTGTQFAAMLQAAEGGSSESVGVETAAGSGSGTDASGPSAYTSIINAAAAQYGLDPAVLEGLVHQESGFDPNAVSSAGAEGLTQVMPENFAADGITNPFDPTQSIDGGAAQLSRDLREFNGNYTDALAAYNAGSAAVAEYGGVPPYTQTENYVTDVLGYAAQNANANGEAATTSPTNDPTTLGGIT
jgi:soluble lytic murein transglycosylase-like protein